MELYEYFSSIATQLKMAREHGFSPVRVSSRKNLEGVLTANRDIQAFFCVDDTGDGVTFQAPGGGYFTKQIVSVFVLKQYDLSDTSLADMATQLSICREIARKVISKLIHSASQCEVPFLYVNTKEMAHYDLPTPFVEGYTGVHLVVTFDEPIDLQFNADEWNSI